MVEHLNLVNVNKIISDNIDVHERDVLFHHIFKGQTLTSATVNSEVMTEYKQQYERERIIKEIQDVESLKGYELLSIKYLTLFFAMISEELFPPDIVFKYIQGCLLKEMYDEETRHIFDHSGVDVLSYSPLEEENEKKWIDTKIDHCFETNSLKKKIPNFVYVLTPIMNEEVMNNADYGERPSIVEVPYPFSSTLLESIDGIIDDENELFLLFTQLALAVLIATRDIGLIVDASKVTESIEFYEFEELREIVYHSSCNKYTFKTKYIPMIYPFIGTSTRTSCILQEQNPNNIVNYGKNIFNVINTYVNVLNGKSSASFLRSLLELDDNSETISNVEDRLIKIILTQKNKNLYIENNLFSYVTVGYEYVIAQELQSYTKKKESKERLNKWGDKYFKTLLNKELAFDKNIDAVVLCNYFNVMLFFIENIKDKLFTSTGLLIVNDNISKVSAIPDVIKKERREKFHPLLEQNAAHIKKQLSLLKVNYNVINLIVTNFISNTYQMENRFYTDVVSIYDKSFDGYISIFLSCVCDDHQVLHTLYRCICIIIIEIQTSNTDNTRKYETLKQYMNLYTTLKRHYMYITHLITFALYACDEDIRRLSIHQHQKLESLTGPKNSPDAKEIVLRIIATTIQGMLNRKKYSIKYRDYYDKLKELEPFFSLFN